MTIRRMQIANQRKDTEDQIAQRIAMRNICDRAVKERQEKFPVLTEDNAQKAIDYQNERIAEMTAELTAEWTAR